MDVKISATVSDIHIYSCKYNIKIEGLIPNVKYQLWHFYPNGKSTGNRLIKSDKMGRYEINSTMGGSGNSLQLHKGFHKIGVNKYGIKLQKYDFENWNKSLGDKK